MKILTKSYICASLIIIATILACNKDKGVNTPTAHTESVPDRADEWVYTPYNNQLVRYRQQPDACIITSIYMLVHSMRGSGTPINEAAAQVKFNGTTAIHPHNDEQLANDNQLKMARWDMRLNGLSVYPDHDFQLPDPNNNYNNFTQCVTVFAEILKEGPFVIDAHGHARLVIGIDKTHGTVSLIDPMSPNNNSTCHISSLYGRTATNPGGATCYYPKTFTIASYNATNSASQEDEQFFEKYCKK